MAEHQKYKITERIDAGGMAEVFRGVAESLQGFKKNVAIKRILPHLCKNKKFISMFLDEARLSLHLQHANIVGVFDIGTSPSGDGANQYFIVMEYVEGTHLKGILESLRRQGRTLPMAHVLYILMQVCSGLSYAHDVPDQETGKPLGIVHRDISPPNILISKNGEVKLVDFGLAKATSQIESTDPGVVKGKFSYLSPEAANGREVDRRADIFAVGILLYELLTRKRLFYGENDYQTVELVRQARVPSIRQQNPEVEPDLEAIVRKALARDVNARYQTAGELQEAIAQFLFSRGMKVTSRDVAELVRGCLAERAKSQPQLPQPKSLIDTLILEELNKFTSIEDGPGVQLPGPGAQPLSPDELSGGISPAGGSHVDPGSDFIDTSAWSEELAGEALQGEVGGAHASRQPRSNGQPAGSAAVYAGGAARGTAQQSTSQPQRKATPPLLPAVPPRAQTPAAGGQLSREPSMELRDLADLLEGEKKPAPQDDEAAEPGKGKGPVAAVLAGVAVLLLLAAAGLFWVIRNQAQ